jgi:hypothetical protein
VRPEKTQEVRLFVTVPEWAVTLFLVYQKIKSIVASKLVHGLLHMRE